MCVNGVGQVGLDDQPSQYGMVLARSPGRAGHGSSGGGVGSGTGAPYFGSAHSHPPPRTATHKGPKLWIALLAQMGG